MLALQTRPADWPLRVPSLLANITQITLSYPSMSWSMPVLSIISQNLVFWWYLNISGLLLSRLSGFLLLRLRAINNQVFTALISMAVPSIILQNLLFWWCLSISGFLLRFSFFLEFKVFRLLRAISINHSSCQDSRTCSFCYVVFGRNGYWWFRSLQENDLGYGFLAHCRRLVEVPRSKIYIFVCKSRLIQLAKDGNKGTG